LEESVVDTINELSDLASKLNEKSDTLNQAIKSMNEMLQRLNLGVEAWVADPVLSVEDSYYRDNDDEQKWPIHRETWLGYSKGPFETWQLVTKDVTLDHNDEVISSDGHCALLSSPRPIRARAMKLFPRLLDEIKSEAESVLNDVDEGVEAAHKAAASFTAKS
jgi:hypothetical protein